MNVAVRTLKKAATAVKNVFFSADLDLNPARLEGESFAAYWDRRKEGQRIVAEKLAGRAVWTSIRIEEDPEKKGRWLKYRVQGTRQFRFTPKPTKAEKKAALKLTHSRKWSAEAMQ